MATDPSPSPSTGERRTEMTMTQAETLHPHTEALIDAFAAVLKDKLLAAQIKYGYGDGWTADDWEEKCRADLLAHIEKGDPRDVAAYAAFMWHHGWSTAPSTAGYPTVSEDQALRGGRWIAAEDVLAQARALSIAVDGDEAPSRPRLIDAVGAACEELASLRAQLAAQVEAHQLLALFDMDHQDHGQHRMLDVGYDAQALVLRKFPNTQPGEWSVDTAEPTMWFSPCGRYGIAPAYIVPALGAQS